MKNLLKFEFHKLFRQKSFYICAAVMIGFSILSIILTHLLAKTAPQDLVDMINAPRSLWDVLIATLGGANFTLISGIFIAIFVCEDFSNGAIKNIYSRDFSKTKVFFAKLIVVLCAVLLMFFANLIVSAIIGLILFGVDLYHPKYIGLLFSQLALIVGYSAFTFAISIIFKKMGPAIAISILVPLGISLIFSLLDVAFGLETLLVADFWLDGIATRLSTVATSPLQIGLSALGCIIYACIFIAVSWFINKKLENY